MKRLNLWMQRLYILGFLLFAWWVGPFTRFSPTFPPIWSLAVLLTAWALPTPGRAMGKPLLAGALIGLTIGAVDWSTLDATLLFEFCWALLPLAFYEDSRPPLPEHR